MTGHHLRTTLGLAILAALAVASIALMGGMFGLPSGPTSPPQASVSSPGVTGLRSTAPVTNGPATTGLASPTAATSDAPALGVFIPGTPSDFSKLDAYASLIGAQPAVVMWFQPWSDGGTFSTATGDAIRQRGAMPLVTWEPWDGIRDDPAWSLQAMLDGDHDAFIRRWAQTVASWGHPLYVRLMHEMNGQSTAWAPNVNGNVVEDFVPAWRHVVDLVRSEGANNIRWVWCPNVNFNNPRYTPYADVYPGDDYVDWTCLDGYNYGTSQGPGGKWLSIQTLFSSSIAKIREVTQRPLLIAETASAESGGDKAAWIRDGLGRLPDLLPDVKAALWFETFDQRTGVDWAVDSSPESLAAFRDVVASGVLGGHLP